MSSKNIIELTDNLSSAIRDLDRAQREVFFVNDRGCVCWGDPNPQHGFLVLADRIWIMRVNGAALLAENLNRAAAESRAMRISECEERVKKAKAAVALAVAE